MCSVGLLYVLTISMIFFFFKQKTSNEMRISDWSSDVCSSDLSIGPSARANNQSKVSAAASGPAWASFSDRMGWMPCGQSIASCGSDQMMERSDSLAQ